MNKELEALERGIIEFEKDLEDDCNNEWLKRVVAGMKKCYQRLEAIDNVKPSEALTCLDTIKEEDCWGDNSIGTIYYDECNTIKQALLKAQRIIKQEDELKQALIKAQEQEEVLRIIFEKGVDIATFNDYQTVIEYNWDIRFEKYKRKELTEEEFNLIKEMLLNE